LGKGDRESVGQTSETRSQMPDKSVRKEFKAIYKVLYKAYGPPKWLFQHQDMAAQESSRLIRDHYHGSLKRKFDDDFCGAMREPAQCKRHRLRDRRLDSALCGGKSFFVLDAYTKRIPDRHGLISNNIRTISAATKYRDCA